MDKRGGFNESQGGFRKGPLEGDHEGKDEVHWREKRRDDAR